MMTQNSLPRHYAILKNVCLHCNYLECYCHPFDIVIEAGSKWRFKLTQLVLDPLQLLLSLCSTENQEGLHVRLIVLIMYLLNRTTPTKLNK